MPSETVPTAESVDVLSPAPRVIEVCAVCREELEIQRYSAGREVKRDGKGRVIFEHGLPIVTDPGVVVCSPACAAEINK